MHRPICLYQDTNMGPTCNAHRSRVNSTGSTRSHYEVKPNRNTHLKIVTSILHATLPTYSSAGMHISVPRVWVSIR